MNQASGLIAGLLAQPEDPAPWRVLSDWFEEQGDPDSLARVELLRLRATWAEAATDARRRLSEAKAADLLARQPALIGDLHPLLAHRFRVLAAPRALALFLLAGHATVTPRPLSAGSIWAGELKQGRYQFPTTLWLRQREGNRFEGDMREDFTSMYGSHVTGKFYFRGVTVGAHAAFVTWRMEGAASGPGLYEFRVSRRKRWTGVWGVGDGAWNGKIWLKPSPPSVPE